MEEQASVGVATGLAWTQVGGETLTTEVTILQGKGELTLTGKLGDVMKESGQAALSYARSRAEALGLPQDFYEHRDIHIHVPEGAIPKDGPSAGVTMAVAVVSALTGLKVRNDVAMTGEITLRGRVLAVGGVKEKTLAAHRAGIRTIVMPEANRKDTEEIPQDVVNEINLVFVENMDQVLEAVLVKQEKPQGA
jgi:ATP-dependent Lon protease